MFAEINKYFDKYFFSKCFEPDNIDVARHYVKSENELLIILAETKDYKGAIHAAAALGYLNLFDIAYQELFKEYKLFVSTDTDLYFIKTKEFDCPFKIHQLA